MTAAFQLPIRIYWEDTDAGGIVFYANYLKFFERARTEWLRALGFAQEQMRAEHDTMFVVSETSVRYLSPARLDDLLTITVEPRDIGKATMALFQQAWLGNNLLAEGQIRIGCVSRAKLKPTRIPAEILSALTLKP